MCPCRHPLASEPGRRVGCPAGGYALDDLLRREEVAGTEPPLDPAVDTDAIDDVLEERLGGDDAAFHASEGGNLVHLPAAIRVALEMHDELQRGGDLLADDELGQVAVTHEHHRLESGERRAHGVRVDGRHRAVMAGVHGLQHLERLAAAALADDDAVGTHTQ